MCVIKNKPYIGYLEKSKIPVKKRRMKGGTNEIFISENDEYLPYFEIQTTKNIQKFRPSNLVFNSNKYFNGENGKNDYYLSNSNKTHTIKNESKVKKRIFFSFRKDITEDFLNKFLKYNKPNIVKKLQELGIQDDVIIDLYIPYISNGSNGRKIIEFKKIKYIIYSEITSNDYSNMVNHILSSQEYKNNAIYLNMPLHAFGIRESLLYFGDFLSNFNYKLPIISVGSGTAYFEYLIQKIFGREIICVDPNPEVYPPSKIYKPHVFIEPKYKTVDGNGKNTLLRSSNYNKMKDCLLILNWSNPMFKNKQNYDPYDYKAIIKLKPTGFFIVYELFGGAGSDDMRESLSSEQEDPEFKISDEETISYKLLKKIDKTIINVSNVSNKFYRIAYYRKNKVRNISTLFTNNNFFGNKKL
jgi:hypothetical protein